MNFLQLYLKKQVNLTDIFGFIEKWWKDDSIQQDLNEYLGVSDSQFQDLSCYKNEGFLKKFDEIAKSNLVN